MHKIRDQTRRRSYRINIFQISHFKVWISTKEKIDTIGRGGESPGPNFQSFKLYADE
jgi:hypothetical protein